MTLAETFRRLRERDEVALMPYLTAGYPSVEESMANLLELARGGADLIELGVPFSDPIADGPTIQHASTEALKQGATLARILDAAGEIDFPVPVVLMSYLNPLLAYGRDPLMRKLAETGFSGLIIPDLPLEETAPWREAASPMGLDLILLTTPTSGADRARSIAAQAQGFLYYVSVAGTTGTREGLPEDLFEGLNQMRSFTDISLAVGFGLSTPEHIAALRGFADGAIVGSRIVEAIRREENLTELIRELKDATRPQGRP